MEIGEVSDSCRPYEVKGLLLAETSEVPVDWPPIALSPFTLIGILRTTGPAFPVTRQVMTGLCSLAHSEAQNACTRARSDGITPPTLYARMSAGSNLSGVQFSGDHRSKNFTTASTVGSPVCSAQRFVSSLNLR